MSDTIFVRRSKQMEPRPQKNCSITTCWQQFWMKVNWATTQFCFTLIMCNVLNFFVPFGSWRIRNNDALLFVGGQDDVRGISKLIRLKINYFLVWKDNQKKRLDVKFLCRFFWRRFYSVFKVFQLWLHFCHAVNLVIVFCLSAFPFFFFTISPPFLFVFAL